VKSEKVRKWSGKKQKAKANYSQSYGCFVGWKKMVTVSLK
jgi:hypothetical protein